MQTPLFPSLSQSSQNNYHKTFQSMLPFLILQGVCYFFPKIDERTSSFGFSGDQGTKPSEVYGFVGSITTVVASGHFNEFSWDPLCLDRSVEGEKKPIEPISDDDTDVA